MVAHAPKDFYQHSDSGPSRGHYRIAHPDPSYFQPGYMGENSRLLGHGRHRGRTKHGKKHSMHARKPIYQHPHVRDPWGHRGARAGNKA